MMNADTKELIVVNLHKIIDKINADSKVNGINIFATNEYTPPIDQYKAGDPEPKRTKQVITLTLDYDL